MDKHTLKYGCKWVLGRIYCYIYGVKFAEGLRPYGFPIIFRHRSASITLGRHVVLNSNPRVNLAGILRKVTLVAMSSGSEIIIGDHTGLSGAVIFAAKSVRIGSYVHIGVNTVIYDTDFHPLDWRARRDNDSSQVPVSPVIIEDDVWIGGNSIILKGVHIGRAAVIGAGSVVTCNIPEGTVWAGNPARFIKNISLTK
jgi:acetyltransferase-like isoleucine patch superfamily enzyme